MMTPQRFPELFHHSCRQATSAVDLGLDISVVSNQGAEVDERLDELYSIRAYSDGLWEWAVADVHEFRLRPADFKAEFGSCFGRVWQLRCGRWLGRPLAARERSRTGQCRWRIPGNNIWIILLF